MSLIVKGMKMPQKCARCDFCFYGTCSVNGKDVSMAMADAVKDDDCPMVELPPHGRLIDADAFREENKYFWGQDFISPEYDDTLADLVNDAPTVLEAEE